MNGLIALWVCSQVANLPAVDNCHSQNEYSMSCANDFYKLIHNHSPKLYGHANRLPERAELNKGAVL